MEYLLHSMLLTMTFGTVVYAFISFRDTTVLLIAGVIIVYGFGTWFLGHKLAPILSKIFFSKDKKYCYFPIKTIQVYYRRLDRKSTRLNSSHIQKSRMPSSA